MNEDGRAPGHLKRAEGGGWTFSHLDGYAGAAISLTLPVRAEPYHFSGFPAIFEGLLPEGPQLEALLRKHKIDRGDVFRQQVTVGADLVGSLTVVETPGGME